MKKTIFTMMIIGCSMNAYADDMFNDSAEFGNSFKPNYTMNFKFNKNIDNKIEKNKEIPSTFIVNGTNASISEFPFYARLVITNFDNSYGHTCGASIINNKYILTAAHCVDPVSLSNNGLTFHNLAVVINNDQFSNLTLNEMKPVKAVFIHPKYNSRTIENDIAIIELKYKIKENFAPIHLPTFDDKLYYDQLAAFSVSGMGYINNSHLSPSQLKTTEVEARSDSECEDLVNSYYGKNFPSESAICVTPIDSNGSCNGDSGGPLTYLDEFGVQQQIGIVSYGSARGCAINNVPNVYTEVYNYEDWIKNVVNNNLNPTPEIPPVSPEVPDDGGKNGGSFGFLSLGLLGLLGFFRKKSIK